MWKRESDPVPFQISTVANGYKLPEDTSSVELDHAHNFAVGNQDTKTRSSYFPSTRAVLWSRTTTGNEATLHLIGPFKKVNLLVNERTLCLVHKQLEVVGGDTFVGFFIGSLHFTDEYMNIEVDRFDPGRPSQNKLNENEKDVKVPTVTIPGDVCIPVTLNKGMAFVDHVSTETYTSAEFLRTFYVLNSWFSRKEKLDPNQFLNFKMKCSFVTNTSDVLAYISVCCVHVNGEINIQPVNSIPIIPTALARNLEDQLSLSQMDNRIKTGYLTMDQTRKLLLLLDTDPKALTLPLVGVWLCGVDTIESVEVWTCCMRFLQNEYISERVYVPPCNYLFVLFSPINANPLFYEFSSKTTKNGVDFRFRSACEGIQLQKSGEDDIHFDLSPQSGGLLHNNFKAALSSFTDGGLISQETDKKVDEAFNDHQGDVSTNQTLDDSLPQTRHSLSPHPQQLFSNTPSNQAALDVSLCESLTGNLVVEQKKEIPHDHENPLPKQQSNKSPLNKSPEIMNTGHTRNIPTKQRNGIKNPRQTKASLIRMNLNKPVVQHHERKLLKDPKQKKLPINFGATSKSHLQNTKQEDVLLDTKYEILQKVDNFIQSQNNLIRSKDTIISKQQNTNSNRSDNPNSEPSRSDDRNTKSNQLEDPYSKFDLSDRGIEQLHDESIPRIPVSIRHDRNNETILSVLEPTYCPENYSDFEEKSFVIENKCNSNSLLSDRATMVISNSGPEIMKSHSENHSVTNTPALGIRHSGFQIRESNSVDQSLEEEARISFVVESPDAIVEEPSVGLKVNANNELYDVVIGQQKQLSALKEQLQIFLNHQEQKKDVSADSCGEKADDHLSNDGVVTKHDLLTFQDDQRKQLEELQKQVQLFLQQTTAPKSNTTEISTQYSMVEVKSPSHTSIGVNTGKSLLWPTENMASTGADTTPRGNKQAEGLVNKKHANSTQQKSRKPCRCCHHCHKQKESSMSSFIDDTLGGDHSHSIPKAVHKPTGAAAESFSELQSEDIQTPSLLNKTTSTDHTLASSLKGVDMPGFNETQEDVPSEPQHQLTNLYDWERSPKLGESASVLIEKRRQQQHQLQQQQQQRQQQQSLELRESIEDEENVPEHIDKTEFYAEMMNQVHKLMEAQNISPQRNDTGEEKKTTVEEEDYSEPPQISPEQRLMKVRDATLRELHKLTATEKSRNENRPRSMSAISPPHPKINYISMSVDDTIYDYSTTNIDSIAAKYLPTEYLSKHQSEIKNKTVKFEGVYKWETPGRLGVAKNMTSVNFSCNMSIASRKYLKKYELIENEDSEEAPPLRDHNGRKAVLHTKKHLPFSSDQTDSFEGKENILDLKKLRNLPKLK